MPEAGLIKNAVIGVAILVAIAAAISLFATYWYYFLIGAAAIGGLVYFKKHKTRIANRV